MRLAYMYTSISPYLLLCMSFILAFCCVDRAIADDSVFTTKSLNGTYSVTSTGRGGQAAQASLGISIYNGDGTFSGSIKTNLPGNLFGERIIREGNFEGTYTVNPDGTGTATTPVSESIFVITKTITNKQGIKVAQEATFITKDLEPPTGNLVTVTIKRLPDEGKFNQSSLKGLYSLRGTGQGGLFPVDGVGSIAFDGEGKSSGPFKQNIRGASFSERAFYDLVLSNNYTVNPDGTGNLIPPAGPDGEADFVITKAKVVDGVKVATEFFFITKGTGPVDGNLGLGFFTSVGN